MKKRTRVFAVACTAALLCVWSGCSLEERLLPTGSSPLPPPPALPPLPEAPASAGTSSRQSRASSNDDDGKRKKDRKKKDNAKLDGSNARGDDRESEATSNDERATRITNDVSKDEPVSASFVAEVEIDRENSTIEVEGALGQPEGSDGMDPSAEEVALEVGSFSATIPAGSFKLTQTTPVAQFRFEGNVDGVNLEMSIRVLDEVVWFEAEVEPVELPVSASPLVVVLRIGDATATTTATADIR